LVADVAGIITWVIQKIKEFLFPKPITADEQKGEPMARYINADDAIYELDRVFSIDDFKKIIRAISRTPTADVRENVKGEWIDAGLLDCSNVHSYRCSRCGYWDYGLRINELLYCPHCGAMMERSEDE